MTVEEMLDRMSSFELTCWKALWKLRNTEAEMDRASRSGGGPGPRSAMSS